MKRSSIILLLLLFVVVVSALECAFTVDQTQRAILLQFGRPVGESSYDPGLHFKLPFVQDVLYFDSRILDYDAKPEEILTEDKKNMVVDSYAKWRIENPLTFYRKFKTIPGALARLDDVVRGQLREVLGRYELKEIVAHKRKELLEEVTVRTREQLKSFGISVVDVRIRRTDLPPENQRAIFNRMRAERERQAKQYRAEGQEMAAKIRAQADKERAVLLSEAQKKSQIIRGEGEAEATSIYATALEEAPDFYEFKRSLEAYEKSLKDGTRVIMTPKSPFLKHFQ
ncbi:membrane protease subunit HflC [Paucidesulfovibrio gracilis DSM 16080]|uniref:Protein HflC n=1 Tax=Paucidesulfovibrio gracilis DSM 16080 TaxID=1121449 RepID=A0A1T4X759_9BACT|nr:protease modulator HflC [Paucidesulfovibrio gracilis]SKA85432.1 membrane protease subunit HflC [Paucidesulfovibrio gracilis DSM 16080]